MEWDKIFEQSLTEEKYTLLEMVIGNNKTKKDFAKMVTLCAKYDLDKDRFNELVELWIPERDNDVVLGLAASIFYLEDFVYEYLMRDEEYAYGQVIYSITDFEDINFSLTSERLLRVLNVDQANYDWDNLVSDLSEFKDKISYDRIVEIETYLISKIRDYSCSQCPEWAEPSPVEKVDFDSFSEEPLTKIEIDQIKCEDEFKGLVEFLLKIQPYEAESGNQLVDHFLGIPNSKVGKKCRAINGKCRMLTCDCFENGDWFAGECYDCHHKIEKREYAIRYPVPRGGWECCFCSLECMLKTVTPRLASKNMDVEEEKNRLNLFYSVLKNTKVWY